MDSATIAKLNLTSDAFRDGEAIPAQFTCDGGNRSPALSWGEPPEGMASPAVATHLIASGAAGGRPPA